MERLTIVSPPSAILTGSITSGSAVVTGLASTARLQPGQKVTGPGVPMMTLISSVDSSSQVTLTNNATTTNASTTLTSLVEPVFLAEAKLHLKVDFPDDDTKIASLITSARQYCETRLRQAFLTQSVALHLDEFPWGGGYLNRQIRRIGPSVPYWLPSTTTPIELFNPPVQSVTSVQYYDFSNTLQTVSPSLYEFEQGTPARIMPVFGQTWPIPQPRIGAVVITYLVGYGDTGDSVPENIKDAMLLYIGERYMNREPSGSTLESINDALSSSDHGEYA